MNKRIDKVMELKERMILLNETKHVKINVQGMTCAACSASVERALRRVDGVVQATVNLATNSVRKVKCVR